MVRRGEHHHHYNKQLRPQSIVDGLRTGNAFSASGQLIDRLAFVACVGHGQNEASAESAAAEAAQDNTPLDREGCPTRGEKRSRAPGPQVPGGAAGPDPSRAPFRPSSFYNPPVAQ